MNESLSRELARRIKLVVVDVDGVMTDGGLIIGVTADGQPFEQKRFEVTDGLGIKLMVWAGLEVYIVSGRRSAVNRVRAEELDVPYREADGGYKLPVVDELRDLHDLDWAGVCCICDDLADVPILEQAGLAIAVANAVPEVKRIAHWQTSRKGGDGAVRELAEALLRAQGTWDSVLEEYLEDRRGAGNASDLEHTRTVADGKSNPGSTVERGLRRKVDGRS